MVEIVFWILIGLILYAYVGYFVLLFGLSGLVQWLRDVRYLVGRRERRSPEPQDWPQVSLLVAAYNEEAVIAERIQNALASEYPRDRLEIVIASDGSDDRTPEVVRQFEHEGVRLLDYRERGGKVSVLNRSIPQCRGQIVVLSDATTMYEPRAIARLVRHFADERVGVVAGELHFGSPDASYKAELRYWRYEVMLKFMENRLGVVMGSSGAIYAIRRALFEPVPPNTINDDFVIPMRLRARGARMVYEPEAIAQEQTAPDVQTETVRRVRIAAGNYRSLWTCRALLNPFRGWIALCFWSHKVARWLVPFWLLGLLATSAVLTRYGPAWCRWVLIAQGALYAAAVLGHMLRKTRPWGKLFGLPYYFTAMNLSLLRGFGRCVFGRQAAAWRRG